MVSSKSNKKKVQSSETEKSVKRKAFFLRRQSMGTGKQNERKYTKMNRVI